MSAEYWLVSQAVPYFTQRLGERYEVNLCHGARMFQLLFAGGWEPTKVHFEDIPDQVWGYYEKQAVSKKVPHISYEVFPLCTRLPDKRSIPAEPEDSMIPVAFRVGDHRYIVPLTCTIEQRNNGCNYLDVKFDLSNTESPYVNAKGEQFGEDHERDGEDLTEFLVEELPHEPAETDFDDALREFVFDRLSARALRQGSESFYKAWNDYLIVYEQEQILDEQFSDKIRELRAKIYRLRIPKLLQEFDQEYDTVSSHYDQHYPNLPTIDRYRGIVRQMESRTDALIGKAQSSEDYEMPSHQSV